ncbi:MAG: protein kinase [Solirubrobacterales bacterium]
MDSLDTLVHARPGGDSPPRKRIRRRIVSPGAGPGAAQSGAEELVLGRYRLIERLGSGGFGVVWRAHDEQLHREVALKRVLLGAGGGPVDSERATREALASARLAHPAIVALYEACAADDAFYLITELVQGDTLAELFSAGSLADEELLEIGLALTDALAHAHARGVIHRDVKPQNVLVPHSPSERGGVAKLTDFGGARLAGEDALTRTGDVLGTLAYMAPEQSEGKQAAEPADLYALALVMYEGLAGVNPVRGSTPADTARRIGAPIAPLERRRGDLPRELTRALDAALDPDPHRRGTLAELHDEFEYTLEQGLGRRLPAWRGKATVGPDPIPEASPDVEQAPARSHIVLPRAVWAAGTLAAVVWQVWAGRPGAALLLLAGAVPLALLPRRAGLGWLAGGLAPVLGLAGLAGAFPAVAGQASHWRARAALGALGYWWMTLAEPLAGRHLWLGSSPGTPARAVWEGSLSSAAVHVIGPMLSLGLLLGATLWAVGAALLPWIVRGRSAALDVVAATTWSAAIAAAAPALDSGLSAHGAGAGGYPDPRGAVLGAVLGGLLAVAARALRGPV